MVGFWVSRSWREVEVAIAKATSSMIPAGHEDIAQNLEVCDLVRSKAVPAAEVASMLRERLREDNANVQILTLGNGGDEFFEQIAQRSFMDELAAEVHRSRSPEVRAKILRCLQDWRYFAQTKPEPLGYIEQVAKRLESENYAFPPPDPNAVAAARAFAETLTAPEWNEGTRCTKCRVGFSTFMRKHHCRNCGRVFCYQCSGHTMPLPWYGIGQDVRVCDGCFARKKPFPKNSEQAPPKPKLDPNQRAGTEDADLARAIALSLQDTHVSEPATSSTSASFTQGRIPEGTDAESDPDLAAAIAASLRDVQTKSPSHILPPTQPAPQATSFPTSSKDFSVPAPASIKAPNHSTALRPSLEVDARDIDNVLTFSQTVLQPNAPWKAQIAQEGMPRPVQNMYEKASRSRLPLVRNLDEGNRRLRELNTLHQQVADAVRMYDRLLDAQVTHATTAREPTSWRHAELPTDRRRLNREGEQYPPSESSTRYESPSTLAPSAPSAHSQPVGTLPPSAPSAPSAPTALYAPSAPSAPYATATASTSTRYVSSKDAVDRSATQGSQSRPAVHSMPSVPTMEPSRSLLHETRAEDQYTPQTSSQSAQHTEPQEALLIDL